MSLLSLNNKISNIEYGAWSKYVEYVTFPSIENRFLFILFLNRSSETINSINTAGQKIIELKDPILLPSFFIDQMYKNKWNY